MAAFNAADLTATTQEGAMLQLAQLLQQSEQNYVLADGAVRENRVALSINTDSLTASISVTLPLTMTVAPGGAVSYMAAEYAVDAA